MRKILAATAIVASVGAVLSLSACNDKKKPPVNPTTIVSEEPSDGWESASPEPSVSTKHWVTHSPSHTATHTPSHRVTHSPSHSVNPSASKVLTFSPSPDEGDPFPDKP